MLMQPTGRAVANRRGVTVMEMVVAMAIVAFLAAVLVPALRTRQQAGDAAGVANMLRGLRQAIANYRDHTAVYPSSIIQLQALPGGGDAAQTNSCGATVAQAQFNAKWRGSYFGGLIGTSGLQVGAMTVSPDLTRTELGGNRAFLRIAVADVNQGTAEYVDASFDGGAFSPSSGAVIWTETGATDVGTLHYRMPVEGC